MRARPGRPVFSRWTPTGTRSWLIGTSEPEGCAALTGEVERRSRAMRWDRDRADEDRVTPTAGAGKGGPASSPAICSDFIAVAGCRLPEQDVHADVGKQESENGAGRSEERRVG